MAKSMFRVAMIAVAIVFSNVRAEDAPKGSSDWPCWRGPDHNGVAPRSPKLLDAWPKEGPKLLWKSGYVPSACGGWSSCAVADGKVFATYTDRLAKDGSQKIVPITAEFLKEMSFADDPPADLVKKIEDTRMEGFKRRNLWDWKQPERDAWTKEFVAGLDPKVAEKYGDFINKRLFNTWPWEYLTGVAQLKDKEFRNSRELGFTLEKTRGYGYPHNEYAGKIADESFKKATKWTDTVVCMDAETGKELWRKSLFDETVRAPGDYSFGASSTPAVADGKCYVFGLFGIYCLSAQDGSVVWEKKTEGDKGTADSSPLVLNGVLYGCPFRMPLCALNCVTGKVLWQQPKVTGQGSPVLWAHEGKTYIVFSRNGSDGTYCIDPVDGKVVWMLGGCSWTTAVVTGDNLLIGARKKMVFMMTPAKAELVWEDRGGQDELYVGSALAYQGYIYDGQGRCLDLKTGEVKWSKGAGYCYCSPCLVDGKVFGYTHVNDGDDYIHMWRPNPEKYELLAQFKPKAERKGAFAHITDVNYVTSPAIANGKLYVRMSDCVYCYDLTEAGK